MMAAPAVAPQVTAEFQLQKRWYIIHNASTKPVEKGFVGTIFTFPARDEISPKPGFDADNDPIPGTLVIEDMYGPGHPDWVSPSAGEDRLVLDAGACVKFILGIDANGRAVGPYAVAGLSLVPKNSTKEQIAAIVEAGIRRHVLHRRDWARQTIEAYNAKASKWKTEGLENPPPGDDYYEALEIHKAASEERRALVSAESVVKGAAAEEEDELKFIAYAKAKAAEMAEEAGGDHLSAASKAKLAVELLEDPRVKTILKKDWRIRRKGHLEETEEQLQEQIAAQTQSTKEEGSPQDAKV